MPKQAPADEVEYFWDLEQGSTEWFNARLATCTASVMKTVMASGKVGADGNTEASKTRTRLLYRFAGEQLGKMPAKTYENDDMRRGRTMEAAAIRHYEFTRNVEVKRCGFIKRTIRDPLFGDLVIGASPDGLVGDRGIVQIKTMEPELICELVDSGRMPSEHRQQCHSEIWASGRDWCDLKIFYEDFPLSPVFHITRDDHYIETELKPAVDRFTHELRDLIKRLKQKGGIK